jgi:hypothetical protein
MSSVEPPGRDRLPKPIVVGGGWAFVYVALAIACLGAVGYLVAVQGQAWTSPAVLAAGVGALWFTFRAILGGKRR